MAARPLQHPADLDSGLPPLALPARRGDVLSLAEMITPSIDVDAKSVCGWSALADAAWAGRTSAAGALIAAGANVQALTNDGLTPLMLAAGQGHATTVSLLLEAGADPNTRSDDGRSALDSALQNGHMTIARRLITRGAEVYQRDAVAWVRLALQRKGCRIRKVVDSRYQAAHQLWAVDQPPRLRDVSTAPLGRRVLRRTQDSIELVGGVWFRHLPAVFRSSSDGERLPDTDWRYRRGWTEHASAVLHSEVLPEQADDFGFIALLDAVRRGRVELTRALLARGADPNARPDYGCMRGATVLTNAAAEGHAEIVQMLAKAGADLDARTASETTPTMAAAAAGHLSAARLLARLGADLDLRNAQGQTALMIARSRGHIQIVRMLLVASNVRRLAVGD